MKSELDEVVVSGGGRRIGWLARGPESGRAVLYLHGWPGSRLEQRLIPSDVLERHHVRLISVDRPGYGNTDPLHGERSARVGDVLEVCNALGINRFPVMGVSCGGSNVVTLAAVAPDRVTGVILVSGQMPYDDDEAISTLAPDQLAELPLCRSGRTPELEDSCSADRAALLNDPVGWLGNRDMFSEAEYEWLDQPGVREALADDFLEGVRPGIDGLVEDAVISAKSFDVDVAAISCPVVAVHGTDDNWEPLPNLRRFLAVMPHSRLILIDGMNHLGPMLYPDLLISLASQRTSSP